MKRAIIAICVMGLILLVVWIARNTEWVDTPVPGPLGAEARRNPFYAQIKFAQALGATAQWDEAFVVPPPNGVLVVAMLHWSVNLARQHAIEEWVERGGRLVLVGQLTGGADAFSHWSGIERQDTTPQDILRRGQSERTPFPYEPCATLFEDIDGVPIVPPATPRSLRVCDIDMPDTLVTKATPIWQLRGDHGVHGLRVPLGAGRVTVINASPFWERDLLKADHGRLFAAATQIHPGDAIHFLSEADYPALTAIVWRQGGPIVLLGVGVIGLALWRGAVRFGPPMAPPSAARRSLAEQIRGTGWFALRHGGGEALHAAAVRALDDAAAKRVHGYARLPAADRTAAVARLTGCDKQALAAAIHHPSLRRSQELLGTIALIEGATRRLQQAHATSGEAHEHGHD